MKELDYGKGYRYAHDEEDGFAAGETYLPQGMESAKFYHPVERGLEIKLQISCVNCATETNKLVIKHGCIAATGDQWARARQHVCTRGTGLHHGLRHHQLD